jgi:8-oxo-dGTP diphosphatase
VSGVADDAGQRSRPYVAAGVLLSDEAGRFMLVRPTYKEYWDLPGGYVEAGETPAQAAAREVREELGISVAVGPLLVADWAPHPDEGDKLLLVFDGGTLTAQQQAAVRLPSEELASYAFHEPAQAAALLIPRLGSRVTAAVGAQLAGRTTYLEHGLPHPG